MIAGQKIGPFAIEAELGSGAMGTVYRARYIQDNRLLALKVISFGLTANDSALARFEREAVILKQLKHPNIVRLFATGKFRGTPFFAMEYIDGESLDRVIARRDRFTWQEVIEIGKQLCAALQHSHERGIIHRDLKPSNLMVTSDGIVKLTDFGIAKDMDVTALTAANNTIGTASYMSPEQCKGDKNLTSKSDLYSLGVVFFELLTGHKPFQGESSVDMFLMHVNEPQPRVRGQPGCLDVPQGLDTLVHHLMEKKPEQRPRDAAVIARILEEIEEKETSRLSRGEEVAKARLVDGVEMAPMDENDRETAKSIRAAARKKKALKKKTAFYRQGWFVGAGAFLIIFTMALVTWLLLRPESAEKMLAAVDSAKTPDGKEKAAKEFLAAYGKRGDPSLEKDIERIRQIYKDAKVTQRETVLLNRHRKPALRQTVEEGDDMDAYNQTMAAFQAEEDGDVFKARTTWKGLADEFQNMSQEDMALWGWIAAKRLKDLQQVDDNARKVERAITAAADNETAIKVDDATLGRAVEAERFKLFGDEDRARENWENLARDLKGKTDARNWYLLASMKAKDLPARRMTNDDRKKMLQDRLAKAEDDLTKAADNNDRVLAGKVRLVCREIQDLYGNDETFKEEAQKARMLMGKAPR